MKRVKFPSTPYLQDIDMENSMFVKPPYSPVVVTEKLDGSNITMTRDFIHARSMEYPLHPAYDRVKALHASIKHLIPEGVAIHGEDLNVKRAINYDDMPASFAVFATSVQTSFGRMFQMWENTLTLAMELDLRTVPVIYSGLYNYDKIMAAWSGYTHWKVDAETKVESEGFVVRLPAAILFSGWDRAAAKYVRAGHVQPEEEHWMNRVLTYNNVHKG